ncbi:type IV secretion-like conjugative transfer system protein TrbJ [Escherichia coli DEC1B]|nr:type IV secretion-like conjugative transfer system protein TrbJ [Escherichia coli DEC1B]
MRNKQVVLLIVGISGIATGIIVSLNIPFIRQGLFYPASPVEIVVSLCLTFFVSVVFFVGAIVGWISVSYYSRITCLNESSEISEETYDERKINDTELEIKQIEREIERGCDNAKKYFWLFVVFFAAGLIVRNVMHDFFSAGIDSWKADPELNNFRYMWNTLMYVIPIMLYALAAGFLAAASLSPLCEIIFGGVRIFLLKRRMRRENSFREGNNDAVH